jgi:hypothetical protein
MSDKVIPFGSSEEVPLDDKITPATPPLANDQGGCEHYQRLCSDVAPCKL